MLKLYKRTIMVSICLCVAFIVMSISLKILFSNNEVISFLQNYIIGVACSILVVIITTVLQYMSEHEKIMSEYMTILRKLILNIYVALSYQEGNTEEKLCKDIIECIKENCDKLNQLNKSFCCFNKRLREKHFAMANIVTKLYINLLGKQNEPYYVILKEEINYKIYIEIAKTTNEFIVDDINNKMIDELIQDAEKVFNKNQDEVNGKKHNLDIVAEN